MRVEAGREQISAVVLQSIKAMVGLLFVLTVVMVISLISIFRTEVLAQPFFYISIPALLIFSAMSWKMRNGATAMHAEIVAWAILGIGWMLLPLQIYFGEVSEPPRISAVAVLIAAIVMPRTRFLVFLGLDLAAHVAAIGSLGLEPFVSRFQILWAAAIAGAGLFVWFSTHQERDERVAANDRATEAEQELRDLLDSTHDGVMALDQNRQVAYFNDSWTSLMSRTFGKTPTIGKSIDESVPPDLAAEIHAALDEDTLFLRHKTAGPKVRSLDISAARLRQRNGWILSIRDMTTLDGLRTRIKTGEATVRREMLNMISHEISTPLTPALLTTFTLLKKHDWQDTDGLENSLERIQRDVQRAIEAVHTLVLQAETERGPPEQTLEIPSYGR